MWCLIWAFNYLFILSAQKNTVNKLWLFLWKGTVVAVFLAADWVDIIQLDLCLYTLQNHNLGWGGGPLHPAGGFHAVGKLTEAVEQNMDYQLQYRMNDSLKKMDNTAQIEP